MDKPTVLFLFFQASRKVDGGVNSLFEIIRGLEQVTPVVVTNRSSAMTDSLQSLGIEVHFLDWPTGGGVGRFKGIGKSVVQLNRWLKGVQASVAHVNDIQTLMFSIWVLRKRKIRVLFNIRGVIAPDKKYKFTWFLVNFCERIIVLSNSMKQELWRRLPLTNREQQGDRFQVIYSIVDTERFRPIASEDGKRKGKELLVAATFYDIKNQRQFIQEALPELVKHGYIVHFIGDMDNAYAQECRNIVEENGWQAHALFHGFQSNMPEWYNRVSFTLIPSRREGLARCMIESLACGTPVVSFDVASAHEILTEHACGVVVNQGDYIGLVQAVESLYRENDNYMRMRERGLKTAQTLFNREEIISNYEAIYLNLC